MKTISIVMSAIFVLAGVMETSINLINAFTLLVIAIVYFRGYQKGISYTYTASLIAVIFALLSLLVLIASFVDNLLVGTGLSLSWSLIGFVSLPLILRIKQ